MDSTFRDRYNSTILDQFRQVAMHVVMKMELCTSTGQDYFKCSEERSNYRIFHSSDEKYLLPPHPQTQQCSQAG